MIMVVFTCIVPHDQTIEFVVANDHKNYNGVGFGVGGEGVRPPPPHSRGPSPP